MNIYHNIGHYCHENTIAQYFILNRQEACCLTSLWGIWKFSPKNDEKRRVLTFGRAAGH
jgi:hypothetical protein